MGVWPVVATAAPARSFVLGSAFWRRTSESERSPLGWQGRAAERHGRTSPVDAEVPPGFLAGGGEMGAHMRAIDWTATSLGPVQDWPGCLRTAVSLVLALPLPGVLLWGPHLTVAAYNDAYRERRGDKAEVLGLSFLQVWAEAREVIGPQLEQAMSGESVSVKDMCFTLWRNGAPEQAYFDYSFSPVRDEAGCVAGVLHVAVETTAKMHAEAAQHESETRWSDVYNHMGEGFEIIEIISDPQGQAVDFRYVDVNAAWERHTGFPREMVVGRRATEVFPPQETPFWIGAYGQVSETGEPRHIERYFPPADRWLELIVYRLALGRVAILLRDVSERYHAAERLRASAERLRLIVEGARDYAIFTTDPEDWIDAWMPGAELVFGWSAEEAVGQPAAITFTPGDREKGVPEREVEAARRDGVAPNVRWHLRKDGTRVFIEGSVTALRGEDGEIRGFLKIGQDVTGRRAAEERQALLMREVDHRAKNALSVVGAALRLTRAPDLPSYIRAIEGRIAALGAGTDAPRRGPLGWSRPSNAIAGRAGGLPHPGSGQRATGGGKWAESRSPGGGGPALCHGYPRTRYQRDQVRCALHANRPPLHQLGTGGWGEERLRFRWAENGGPPLEGKPEKLGFGTRVLDGTVRQQLGGGVTLAWNRSGLVCEIEVPLKPRSDLGEVSTTARAN